jgi:hypothetical protein
MEKCETSNKQVARADILKKRNNTTNVSVKELARIAAWSNHENKKLRVDGGYRITC